jgi:hypothetical protein
MSRDDSVPPLGDPPFDTRLPEARYADRVLHGGDRLGAGDFGAVYEVTRTGSTSP